MKPVHVCLAVLAVLAAPPVLADSRARDAALKKLQEAAKGTAAVSSHRATGVARFVRLPPASRGLGMAAARTENEKKDQSAAFFRNYGAAIGVSDPAGLRHVKTETDAIGETHLTYRQFHGAVPVFAGTVKVHFDAANRLKGVSGTAIPDLTLNETPVWSSADAAEAALASTIKERGASKILGIGSSTLYVYREGLSRGIPGRAQLAWEIEVTDGAGVRDLVYVDAHTGMVIERVNGIQDDMYRRAYDGQNLPFVPNNYPNGAYWLEGQRYPTASQEANNMIDASKDVYDLFRNAFGRDSFDGHGAKMDAIFDRGYSCPNASWNGTFISFCPGITTDDVTAHEWGHAYTQYTHDLIYAWQPGALNESYSDIWGETVDFINGHGTDNPSPARAPAVCSTFSPPVGTLRVNQPADIAGDKFAQSAQFGAQLTQTGITGDVVVALDAADAAGPSTIDGCGPLTNGPAVSGKIAIIRRGTCEFSTKVLNAQNAGAIAVIIDNNAAGGLPGMGAGAVAAQVTIPSVGIQLSDGEAIRTRLAASTPVNATLLARPGSDPSLRWLMGEDSTAVGLVGALRDMWNPTCYSNAGKVSDTVYYQCGTADNGGVHSNSGIPNHAYALIVDGGTYNGQTIAGIGLTKAAHIYYRAQSVYQVQDSDFADHADALDASCADLVGAPLNALRGGASGEVITTGDCAEVSKAIAAVELRSPPACVFTPLLDPRLPALCSTTTTTGTAAGIASFDFEANDGGFTVSRDAGADFTPRDWTRVSSIPAPRTGSAFFAPDPNIGTCAPGGDESGVLHLDSPAITLPATTAFARATFMHWVATEPGIDGGNLKVSVNGGPWQLVPPSEFTFNNYIAFLVSAADGNTNPLAGQPAWTGTNNGTASGGSWGRTHVNLASFARAGDTIRLRWDLGTDGCGGRTGWYLDDVNVFSCTPSVPSVGAADIAFDEGSDGKVDRVFTVALSQPTLVPVAVEYQIVDGTAVHGEDFETVLPGSVVIPPGSTSATVTVTVKGDTRREANETFSLRLSNPVNATIEDGEATATIVDDDTP